MKTPFFAILIGATAITSWSAVKTFEEPSALEEALVPAAFGDAQALDIDGINSTERHVYLKVENAARALSNVQR